MTKALLGIALGLGCALSCSAKKIFWVPFPGSVSHHMLAAKVGRELASRGHEFLVVNTDYDGKQFGKVNTEGITEVLYKHPRTPDEMHAWLEEVADLDPFTGTKVMVDMIYDGCDNLLQSEEVLSQIRDADVIVVDAAVCCGSVVRDYLKIPTRVDFLPVTFMDPFYAPRLGSMNLFSNVPQMGSRLTPDMDFGERIHNTIVGLVDMAVEHFVSDVAANKLREKYGLEGSHKEAMGDTGVFISQSTWVTEFPRAIAPAIKMVGPILPEDAKALEGDLGKFVAEDGGHGVVIVSFGSQARVEQAIVDKMAEAFAKLKQRVVWKLPGIKPATSSPNVMHTQWFPQNDLLGHPKVIGFLSHGGLNGCSEAAFHGVPVIGFPLFSDQWDNIARLRFQGMATNVDSKDFTADSLAATVESVVTDSTFAANAKKVSAIVRDTGISDRKPVEQAADWIEYAIRHDGAMFHQVPGLGQPWLVKYGYDVTFTLLLVLGVVLYLPYWLLRRCFCGLATKVKVS